MDYGCFKECEGDIFRSFIWMIESCCLLIMIVFLGIVIVFGIILWFWELIFVNKEYMFKI